MKKVLRMNRGWSFLSTEQGFELWALSTQNRFRIRGSKQELGTLLQSLKDGVPTDNFPNVLSVASTLSPEKVQNLVDQLRRLGAVIEATSLAVPRDETNDLYLRQVEFFDIFEREGTSGFQLNEQLRNRRVVVIGVGGFGTWIVLYLSRIGVKHIVAIDPDHVEESNLSRQVLYSRRDIGKRKIDIAAERARDADPHINFEGLPIWIKEPDDLAPHIRGADLVFNPFGYLPSRIRETISIACMKEHVPFILSGSNIFGPLCIPGQTSCYQCLINSDSTLESAIDSLHANRWVPPRAPFAPALAVTSAYVVWEAAKYLSGCDTPKTLNGSFILDPLNYSISFRSVERQKACPLCEMAQVKHQ